MFEIVQAHPEATKIYLVHYEHEHSIFVRARFNAEARRVGCGYIDLSFEEVECERHPALDSFTGSSLELTVLLLSQGWTIECAACSNHCHEPCEDDEGYVIVRDTVFCSAKHAEEYWAKWDARHRAKRLLDDYAQRTWPDRGSDHVYINANGDGIVYFKTNHPVELVPRHLFHPDPIP